jgi:hypothetical protein
MLPTSPERKNPAEKKKPTHKLHIWFLPMLNAKTQKTKRAIFYLRSAENCNKKCKFTIQYKN